MTMLKLASLIAEREGKKSQVKIGDVREVLAIVSDLMAENPSVIVVLLKNGIARWLRKNRRK